MQPPIRTRSENAGLKQPVSSSSSAPSLFARQSPPSPVVAVQYSKCPISSEKATLYEWAAHGTRGCSLEVAYMGREEDGDWLQGAAAGWKLPCARRFAALAVIEPVRPFERSRTTTVRPAAPSWMSTESRSPELMNRSVAALGVNVASVAVSGAGGACGTPLL